MKAFLSESYGDPLNLKMTEVEKPSCGKDQVLIKMKATAINDWDLSIVTGEPKLYRLINGLFKPKWKMPGMEFSGVIEEVGSEVYGYHVGDEVYGDMSDQGCGTFAEYITIDPKSLIEKPNSISFEEAAGTSHAAMLAYQSMKLQGRIRHESDVLINGAGGGVGMFGIQLAKLYDCNVTAVDKSEKFDFMKDLGADHLIDFRKTDFTKTGKSYDMIIDARTKRYPWEIARALKKGGKYISVGGDSGKLILLGLTKWYFKRFQDKHLQLLALKPNYGIDAIHRYFDNGWMKVVMDGPHPFEKIPELIKLFRSADHKGKIIASFDQT